MTKAILDLLKSLLNMRTNRIYMEIKWLHILDKMASYIRWGERSTHFQLH